MTGSFVIREYIQVSSESINTHDSIQNDFVLILKEKKKFLSG
jgi:hypothetical protein